MNNGRYHGTNRYNGNYSQINFPPDKTFNFYLYDDVSYETCDDCWGFFCCNKKEWIDHYKANCSYYLDFIYITNISD